ncbi:MAG: ABC transporter permease [Anaeromyxobacter sp.]
MIRPRRVWALVLRQLYLLRGSPARVLPLFAWVAIDVVLWGFITRYLNQVSAARFDFVPVLLGAVLLWDFFGRVLHGVAMAFFEDVWSRNFLNVFAAPITTVEYVAGLVCSSILTSSIGLAVMLALAFLGFGLSYLGAAAAVVPALLVLFLFGIALGIVGCAVVLRLGPAAEWLIWPVPAMISPFAGVFYPVSTLPPWMQAVSWLLPPSYVFETLRAVLGGAPVAWGALAIAAALAVLDVVLAGWLFVAVHRHAVRTGLLARYSAETVS